ncbi:uncharacterized protein LOC131253389 [Magnolia sinica]|uniref:uncharacterized protein LOC131253389 n=1 Tax=Magnolia sinica TaxID=86752 RepID=UPI0026592473|nr:uncharacterized protein LOC131253389 [Magnolia sinica]
MQQIYRGGGPHGQALTHQAVTSYSDNPLPGMEHSDPLFTSEKSPGMEDYEIKEKKQAAADVLFQYSRFVMVCIGEGVRPCDLRLHLMKELSGMPTSLKKEPQTAASEVACEPSSSGGTVRREKTESFQAL